MSYEFIRYDIVDGIAEIALDRPPVNAITIKLVDELLDALATAGKDDAVRAVIIRSAHKVFCAGLDLDIVRGKTGVEVKRSEEHTSELQSLMRISYAVFCLKKKNTK